MDGVHMDITIAGVMGFGLLDIRPPFAFFSLLASGISTCNEEMDWGFDSFA